MKVAIRILGTLIGSAFGLCLLVIPSFIAHEQVLVITPLTIMLGVSIIGSFAVLGFWVAYYISVNVEQKEKRGK